MERIAYVEIGLEDDRDVLEILVETGFKLNAKFPTMAVPVSGTKIVSKPTVAGREYIQYKL